MGTQQILLIVLSVIIVGVAIAVGITMFSNQAYNSNQQAVASELQNYGSQVIQYFKTPTSQGGAGQDVANVTIAKVATFLGFTGTSNSLESDNGEFRVTAVAGSDTMQVTLKGLGTELKSEKKPLVTTIVSLASGTITSTVSSGTTF
jgi:hypothetical protein